MTTWRDDPSRAGAPGPEDRLVDLLADEGEQDELDEGPLYPLRLVQGEDDVVTDTSRDRGGWSAEELAMHLVQEQ